MPSPPGEARGSTLRDRLRESCLTFGRTAGSASIEAATDAFAADVNRLLGAAVTSVWLLDRRARELVLAGSSAGSSTRGAARIRSEDPDAPAARGLRLDRPERIAADEGTLLVAPLRGLRRALGAIVIEGSMAPDLDGAHGDEIVDEIAWLLSIGVENRQLLDEVVRQGRLLENTFNSLDDSIVVFDNAGRVVQTNEAFAARVGRARTELFEQPIADSIGAEITEWATVESPEAPGGGSNCARTRTFHRTPLGETVVGTVTPLVSDQKGLLGRVLVLRDITAQARLESERETLRTRLMQSEKLAALGQFVAGIAHEMNNPLQGVLGHLELIMRHPAARSVRADLRGVFREANRAAKIVSNLLAFTGSRRLVRRRVKVERVLSRTLAARRTALARAGITVVRRQTDGPAVLADPLLLQQALMNVLINAEHAIAESGRAGSIEITTGPSLDGCWMATTVRDTGPGIPSEVLPRIFDPFFTTKEVGQGTGLGLAITYGIVQEHGGSIDAGNAADGGAEITIRLPAATNHG